MFTALEQAALDVYDKIVGLGLEDLCVDGCIVKAPCGGQAAGHDSRRTRELLEVLGCDARISPRGTPLQAGRRWVIEAFIALANTIITIRNLIHHAWTTHRWDQQPTRKP